MVLAISDISVLSHEQQWALEMENLLYSLAASSFQPSARTCPSMNLGRVNRRSLRTWTSPSQGSKEPPPSGYFFTCWLIDWLCSSGWQQVSRRITGRRLLLPEELDKAIYPESLECALRRTTTKGISCVQREIKVWWKITFTNFLILSWWDDTGINYSYSGLLPRRHREFVSEINALQCLFSQ